MKVVICGNVINTRKILFVTPVKSTTNSANDVYQAFTIVFLNNKPLEINAFNHGSEDSPFLSKAQLKGMRDELVELWYKNDQYNLKTISPQPRKPGSWKEE